ncbi:MAG: hypothetical protein SOR93_17375 [Clostridiales Family XIII bacterium]|nr:hypothetical protein [Clostridia bacterium]MDY3013010.1 hypothetical protein [Clostridiales Family XIII bacterium]
MAHERYKHNFNDIIRQKTVDDYDLIEGYRTIQVAYWIVNPYYEKIYEQVDDKNSVISQGYDYLGINQEMYPVVKGLFKCDISTEVKRTLGRVNEALEKIK